jgi:MFS family permease
VLVGGALGDLYGRRRIFAIGVAGFGAASLVCAAAPAVEVLIVARALQGAFGALLVPSSLAIITAVFSDAERAASPSSGSRTPPLRSGRRGAGRARSVVM